MPQLHTMARSIVVKGVESPERLLDETALFLHRVVTDLPPEKQRMLERLNSSDEDLVGRTVLLVDDDARNIFALSSVLERRGMRVLTATTGSEAIELVETTPDLAIVLMDIMMPEMDGYQTMEAIRAKPGIPPAADHRADGQSHEGRPREMPGGGRLRLSGQARQYRAAAVRAAHVAAPLSSPLGNDNSSTAEKSMASDDKVNILLVDDQPAKLLSYEDDPREPWTKISSRLPPPGRRWSSCSSTDIAVILVDVCMPELDGFQLAAMIREHPRFQKTAIIFISAIHLTDVDRLRAYEMGAVDYVPVPVIPEVLRAKVRVFAELYRKTRQLEQLNEELERRVAERTAELEASSARLVQSEQRRSLALAAGQMGSWEWDPVNGRFSWDDGQYRIFGVDPKTFDVTRRECPQAHSSRMIGSTCRTPSSRPLAEHAVLPEPNFAYAARTGKMRWCIGTAVASVDATDQVVRISGVTIDITDRKEAEERQALLAREVDHRARNALALVQSIVRLTRADNNKSYIAAVEGRIAALVARTHAACAEPLAGRRSRPFGR